MIEQESMRTYFILSLIFGVVFILTLVFAAVVPTQFIYSYDCMEVEVTLKEIYNNKSVDIRVETQEYNAVFTLPPTLEMTRFMDKIQNAKNTGAFFDVKLRVALKKSDYRLLDERPRKTISVRQMALAEDDSVIMLSHADTNEADRQTLMGVKILFTSFAGCALVVCIYHTVRTRPRMQRPNEELAENV